VNSESLRVIVVDDDFLVAKLHGKFIESVPEFALVGTANNYEQALEMVSLMQPDLLLLDVYMPDRSGIDLLREIRSQNVPCDVILISAAKELEVVEEGFRLGIFDYLIKPFDFERFQKSAVEYALYKKQLQTSRSNSMDQTSIDDLKRRRLASPITKQLKKGIDIRTLELVKQCLAQSRDLVSIEEVADLVGISRSTARIYLVHLVEENCVEERLHYGTVGRPQRLFRIR
jgi:response regulator of citrate/malate metabolism